MDKEFEQKVKKKRLRSIVILLLIVAAVIYLILDTDVEKADYTKSLQEQISQAETLYEEAKTSSGNEKGQYAPYTLMAFEKEIGQAQAVLDAEESEYNDKKDAYEDLKEKAKSFEKDVNEDVVEKSQVENLVKSGESETFSVEIKDETTLRYEIKGKDVENPVTINLMAREKGPYYDEINEILGKLSLQGQVLSFYQDGTFGGKLQVTSPIYSENTTTGWVYKVNLDAGKLVYVSKASIDLDEQTAAFTLSEGGDYVVLTKKIHKSSGKTVDIKEAEDEAEEDSTKGDNSTTGSQTTQGGKENTPSTTPDNSSKKEITVSLEIRCDTLAQDLSKLEDEALEAYVPADGTILPATKVTVEEGSTVYDVLNKVCRNKEIHLEASYTPAYGSYYVEGINYLYEFDGGTLSGWMYKVNGVFPNYGSSEYTLKDGDTIVWAYTCDLGKDVGNDSMS